MDFLRSRQTLYGPPLVDAISFRVFSAWVWKRYESIQQKLLEFEASRRRRKAEWGVFEPEVVSAATHEV